MRAPAKAKPARVLTGHVRAGALNRMVQLQRREGADALGQPASAYTTYATVWASVLQLAGREHLGADTAISMNRASIRVRWRDDIQAGDRAVCGGAMLHVAAVLPNLASREYVDLVCTEVASER